MSRFSLLKNAFWVKIHATALLKLPLMSTCVEQVKRFRDSHSDERVDAYGEFAAGIVIAADRGR